ncbi:MAG: hypothetical protein ACE5JR_05125 [Gemmatimonadota bacterium]
MRAAAAVAACVGLISCRGAVSAQEKPADRQIAEAVSAAPQALREDAAVLGYRGGELVTLREGTGQLVCLADDPDREDFHVACYHRSLEPFMAIGRRLRAEGKNRAEVQSARLAALESGDLRMPDHPAALYTLTGPEDSFDPETGSVTGAHALFVVYTPYVTPEQLGVPARPAAGEPWLMLPGTPWAHIMVSRP